MEYLKIAIINAVVELWARDKETDRRTDCTVALCPLS